MSGLNLSDEDLAGLSEQEREALVDFNSDDEAVDGDSQVDVVEETEAGDAEADENGDQSDADNVDDESVAVDSDASGDDADPSATLSIDDRIAEIDNKLAELSDQLENGEIGFSEFGRAQAQLNRELTTLAIQKDRIEQAQQQAANEWSRAQNDFFSKPENAAIREKPLLYSALSQAVNELSLSKEAAGKPYDWLLESAKARLEEQIGVKFGGDKPSARQDKQESALAKTKIPRTLGDMPASVSNDTGKYDALHRLKGQELESKLENMSKDEIDRILEEV